MLADKMEVDKSLDEEFKDLNREQLEFGKKCAKIARDIELGVLSMVQLIEQLGCLLVSESMTSRETGMWILTQVLEQLPPTHLDAKQLSFICTFYSDRFKDHNQVIPAVLRGILALIKFQHFPDEAATQILTALFHNISCQQQQKSDRMNIYKIFELLLDKRQEELSMMGLNFVYGVISAVDGEREPQNLIFLFDWMPKFLKVVDLRHLVEEAFEIMACYFPVDFKTPPKDSATITRDNLAEALAPCLTAIPAFADYCLPLALEKLASSLEIAQLDSLKLLEMGCSTFDVSSYAEHSTEIWSQIQKLLFDGPTAELESACLRTLSSVIAKLSSDIDVLTTILTDIADTVKGNLLPDSKLFNQSSKLLIAVAGASESSSDLIAKEIVPILINTYNITNTTSYKVQCLQVLIRLYQDYLSLHTSMDFDDIAVVPFLCLKASVDTNTQLRTVGFTGLQHITLPLDVRLAVYKNLRQILLMSQTNEVRLAVVNCLKKLATDYPEEVTANILNCLDVQDLVGLELYLDALTVLAPQNDFTCQVIDIFIAQLSRDLKAAVITVNSMVKLLNGSNERVIEILFGRDIISTVINWTIANSDFVEMGCLENVSSILKSLIGIQSSERQKSIISDVLPTVLNQRNSKSYVWLLDGILCRLRQDVAVNYTILSDLTQFIMVEENEFVRNVAVQLLGNLVNKCGDETVLQEYLVSFEQLNDKMGYNYVLILAWITKALIMRNHPSGHGFADKLVELLKTHKHVAVAFRIILNDNYEAFSARSYCKIMFLYRQKFFTLISNRLCEEYQPEYSSYLVALGYLMEFAPRQAILLQFQKIFNLVNLYLTQCDEVEVLLVLLRILFDFIVNKEVCIEEHMEVFLNRLLELASFEKSMQVRILALQCLQKFPSSFPIFKLLSLKDHVMLLLGKSIDDRKRLVRKEAVEARSIWFLLDAPI